VDAAKTTFLQARGVPFTLSRERRGRACSGAGVRFRGANQPGRRVFLEETDSTADRMNSTLVSHFLKPILNHGVHLTLSLSLEYSHNSTVLEERPW